MDILVSFSYRKLAWYKNQGDGTFSSQNIISSNTSGYAAVISGDCDGDGYVDILSACWNADRVSWYKNMRNGNFENEIIITDELLKAESIDANDLDGDGDIDIIAGSYFDENVNWYENLGNGDYKSVHLLSNASPTEDVVICDLNGDGDMDIICSSKGSLKVYVIWYENMGNANFSISKPITSYESDIKSIIAVDLDNDDDLDVLTASSNEVIWFENEGDGSFINYHKISEGVTVFDITAVDIDGDGDSDILYPNYQSGIEWCENLSDGNFKDCQAQQLNQNASTIIELLDRDPNNPYAVNP